jgi:hypothetical protein
MLCVKKILLLIVLAILGKDASAACAVVDRFIGEDSGELVLVTFKYDLTVAPGTTERDLKTTILPAIETALAEKVAPTLIPKCAPTGTDTTSYADIAGMDLDPTDRIAGNCTGKANCYVITCRTSVYVTSTAKDVPAYFFFAMAPVLNGLKTGTIADLAIVSTNNLKPVIPATISPFPASSPQPTIVAEISPPPSVRRTSLPTLAPTDEPTFAPSEASLRNKVADLQEENPVAFYAVLGAIIIVFFLCPIGIIIYCCCAGGK